MYNTTVYGFTYNDDASPPAFVDMILYNSLTDEITVHKVLKPLIGSNLTVETSYRKRVTKYTPLIEDFANKVGLYTVSHEVSDGFFDIYMAGTV